MICFCEQSCSSHALYGRQKFATGSSRAGWRECGRIRGEALATTSHQKLCNAAYVSTGQDLQKRNIRSATILAVFNQFCYVPKHTVREQLLQMREAKREEAAYESAVFSYRRKGRRLCINCFQVGVRERVALSGRALGRFRSNVASGGGPPDE